MSRDTDVRDADGLPLPRLPLARLALGLYPPAWRDRYRDEVLALLEESGGGTRAAASLAWHAVPAWISPPRNLYADRTARMRACLATVLLAWSVLAGLSLVFAQLTQLQGAVPPILTYAAPSVTLVRLTTLTLTPYTAIVTWSYHVFDAALIVSALAIGAGGLPLWLIMLRRAHREHRRRDLARLLMPLLVPTAYLLALVITVSLIRAAQGCRVAHDPPLVGACQPNGVGPWWFLVFVLAGFAAAITAALGPARALRSMKPRGPAVRFAARAAALGVGSMLVAALASGTAAISLYQFARYTDSLRPWVDMQSFQQYGSTATLVVYLGLVVAAAAVAAVSASRAAGAARPDSG